MASEAKDAPKKARKLTPKQQKAANDARITRLYGAGCSGVQVSIHDLGRIWSVGEEGIAAGDDDEALQARIVALVETIRKN